jgi:sugar phosphate isomerase/epimerase
MAKIPTRRQFLLASTLAAAASLTPAAGCVSGQQGQRQQKTVTGGPKLKLGLASYTFREFGLDDTLKMTKRLGLEYITLKSFHLSLKSSSSQIAEVAATVKNAGINLYGVGVIYMNDMGQVGTAFEYAKAAGAKVIIGVPSFDMLELVNQKVREYDIKVAIHNHGPGDKLYPTPAAAYEKIQNLDRRIGLCIDIGHTIRAGDNPANAAEQFADRLLDVHIKDVSEATGKGRTVEIGRGVIDIPEFIETLLRIKYKGVVSFEYEKDAKDPLAGLAESVGYVRGVLAAV